MEIEDYQKKYGTQWLRHWRHAKQAESNDIYIGKSNHRRKAHWRDYDYYSDSVKRLTNENKHQIPNIHKRGFHAYHIDHKISVKFGYDNGILAEHIAHPSNCEMIWWKDNIRKSDKCKVDESNQWIMNEME